MPKGSLPFPRARRQLRHRSQRISVCRYAVYRAIFLSILILALTLITIETIFPSFLSPHSIQFNSQDPSSNPKTSPKSSRDHHLRPEFQGLQYVVHEEHKFNGLGAQMLRMLGGMAIARQNNASFIFGLASLHSKRAKQNKYYWNYGCKKGWGWRCYFQGSRQRGAIDAVVLENELQVIEDRCVELGDVELQDLKVKCVAIRSKKSEFWANQALWNGRERGESHEVSWRNNLKYSRMLFRELFALNGETKDAIENVLNKAGVEEMDQYIGVHIRRGDKEKEIEPIAVQEYVEAIELLDLKNLTVFVATDDSSVIDEFRSLVQNRRVVTLDVEARNGHNQKEWNGKTYKLRKKAVIALLADMVALSRAKFFIGTFSSNLGRAVHLLRTQEPETSISLDTPWGGPGVAWRHFRKRYCDENGSNKMYCNSVHRKAR
eukprot:Plantae.Rhodophyta-Hildenbrandia_rubra.ctg12449.p1 GENE.Plantae.Rhodophyta-Hildenbrandia_rubra.ctg12449~~Plantae.Rhodophyta-Hildenbrandia_rubra.ctg12449.p1  ORF type:complete len:433 (+),score=48.91 Plantae.Rhodophyta-Hildenbrandia_rubra.ctg12449:553-1851(+)